MRKMRKRTLSFKELTQLDQVPSDLTPIAAVAQALTNPKMTMLIGNRGGKMIRMIQDWPDKEQGLEL